MHISSDRDLDNMHIERHRLFSSHRLEGGGGVVGHWAEFFHFFFGLRMNFDVESVNRQRRPHL